MQVSDAHSTDLNRIRRSQVASTNAILCLKEIIDFTTELWILIKIREVWLGEIDLDCISILLFFLMLLLISFGGFAVIDGFIDIALLLLGLVELLHHFRSDSH